MKNQLTEREQDMLNHGISFQVLNKTYLSEGETKLGARLNQEKTCEDHRVWHLFVPGNKGGEAEIIRSRILYEIFHKECYVLNMPVKEVMMVDLLKMGNKRRYDIDINVDFITIPDFFTKTYRDKYLGIEAISVLRWMAYVTGRYGVGFILYASIGNKVDIDEFFNEAFFGYYSDYLVITRSGD